MLKDFNKNQSKISIKKRTNGSFLWNSLYLSISTIPVFWCFDRVERKEKTIVWSVRKAYGLFIWLDRNFYIKWAYCLWFTSMTTLENSSCVISNQRCYNPNTLGNKSYTSRYSYYAAMALEQWNRCSDIYEKRSQYPEYWDYDISPFIRISKWINYLLVRSTIEILAFYVRLPFRKAWATEMGRSDSGAPVPRT
jgi:hypothetical protein